MEDYRFFMVFAARISEGGIAGRNCVTEDRPVFDGCGDNGSHEIFIDRGKAEREKDIYACVFI